MCECVYLLTKSIETDMTLSACKDTGPYLLLLKGTVKRYKEASKTSLISIYPLKFLNMNMGALGGEKGH